MFTAKIITFAVIIIFAGAGMFVFCDKRRMKAVSNILLAIVLFTAIYCVAAGVFLLTDWHDPLAVANPGEIGKAMHGHRGGWVIFAIRFWPYVLIGLGGYFGYMSLNILALGYKS